MRRRRSSAFGLSPVSGPGPAAATAAAKEEENLTDASSTNTPSTSTPSLVARVGEKMRSLTVASPATPAMGLSAFGSPVTSGRERASRDVLGESHALKKKKAAGLGAAAAAAAAEVMGAGRPARGAGGPGRSPIMDLAGRGMGAVARSPLANVR